MGEAELGRMVAARQIEPVLANLDTARDEIATARLHLRAARQIAGLDPTLAFTGLYDAIRKSIQGHMRANGYRVAKGPGAHRKTGEYAAAALDKLGIEAQLDEFDTLRQIRNQSEYGALVVEEAEVARAHTAAEIIVEAVARDLGV
jgi:hypothetical protein